jgi:PIN domain nuclease of toxin-antitoxin system
MKLLLDTHVLIWWSSSSDKLTAKVYDLITDTNNSLTLSIASVWEMQIKVQLGKLNLIAPLPELIANQQQVNRIQILPIELNHIYALKDLPDNHRDPFDRIIISQAMSEKIPVISKDEIFNIYPVEKIW